MSATPPPSSSSAATASPSAASATVAASPSVPAQPAIAPLARAQAPMPEPWTVAALAALLRDADIALTVTDVEPAYGPQIDFGERAEAVAATATGTPAGAADDAPATEGVTPLVEFGLVRVVGRDATAFLQGQLTNDVTLAAADRAILAGLCNPKGRLIVTFALWRGALEADEVGDCYWLACSRDLAAVLAKRLQMFVLRSKVKVARRDHDRVLVGVIGSRPVSIAADVLVEHDAPASRALVRLPAVGTPRVVTVAALDETTVLGRRAVQGGLRWIDTRLWRWYECRDGEPRITAATSEMFVPQMVNLERIGGVSFTKGCYPGQEIVARSHYRGTTKRRMFLEGGAGALPAPGADLDPAPGQTEPAGVAVLAARDPAPAERWLLLAEARIEAARAGLSWHGEPLEPLPLPYSLVDAPADEAEPTGTKPAAPGR